MTNTMRHSFILIIATLLILAGTLVVRGFAHTSASAAAGVPAPEYSILKRAPSASDALTSWRVSPRMLAAAHPELGLRVDQRRFLKQQGPMSFAIVPSSDGACLIESISDGSGNLADGSTSMQCTVPGESSAAAVTYGKATGLVPDGVTSVSFQISDGTQVTQAVSDNVWSAPAEAQTSSFEVLGQVKVIDLMPLSTLPAGARVAPNGLVTFGDLRNG